MTAMTAHDPVKAMRGYEAGVGKRRRKPPKQCSFCPSREGIRLAQMGTANVNYQNFVAVCPPCLRELDVSSEKPRAKRRGR